MITTLPGLYLASVGVIKPVVWLVDLTGKVVCSTEMLRFINLLFNCGILYLLYLIICKLHLKEKVIMSLHVITFITSPRVASSCSGKLQCVHCAGFCSSPTFTHLTQISLV